MLKKVLTKSNILFFLFILFGVCLIYSPPKDPDLGWHLRYGQYNFENKTILKNNIFSFTFPNYYWANSYWLSEILMYLPVKLLGINLGLTTLGLTLSFYTVCTLVFFYNKVSKKLNISYPYLATIVILFFLTDSLVSFRPFFPSTLFFSLLIYILLYKPKYMFILPIIFTFWVNFHADFVLGLLIFGSYVFFLVLHHLVEQGIALNISKDTAKTILYFAMSILVTFINPYGINLHKTLLLEHTLVSTNVHILEWSSAMFHLPLEQASFYLFFYILAFIILYKARLSVPLWYLLCLFIFYSLSIRYVYFVRVLLLISYPIWITQTNNLIGKISTFLGGFMSDLTKKMQYVYVFFFTTLILIFLWKIYLSLDVKRWSLEYNYPYYEVAYINKRDDITNVFTKYAWGGYMIWFAPQKKVFIDGRMTSWQKNNVKALNMFENMYDNFEKQNIRFNLYNSKEYGKIFIFF